MSRTVVGILLVLVSRVAIGYPIEGVEYAPTTTLGGRTLRLLGVGMREVTVFKVDVYTLGAYVEHRTCDLARVVPADETRMLRLHFVRDVGADKMRANMKKSFEGHTPADASDDLKRRIHDFVEMFGIDAKEGTEVEVRYEPASGTSVFVNGRQRGGTIPGHDFNRILWDIYFGQDTCCPSLREGVLRSCRDIQ